MADIAAIAGASRQQSPSARKLAGEFYFTSALVLLWLLGFYVLPGPAPLAPGLDPSWQAALTEAFLHHLQFGKDIVFTHGPWGFLNRPRGNPSIYPWLVSGRLVLALGMSAGYTWIALFTIPASRLRRSLLLFALAIFADPIVFTSFLLFCIGFAAKEERRRVPGSALCIALLIPACALTALVKSPALPLAAGLALIAFAGHVLNRRRVPRIVPQIVPWTACALIACYFGFYLAAWQRIDSLAPYLFSSISMASALSTGAYIAGPMSDLVFGLLLCALMPLVYSWTAWDRGWWTALSGGSWVALYFLLGFKETYYRQDSGHLWTGMVNWTLPASLTLVLLLSRRPRFANGLWVGVPLRRAAIVLLAFCCASFGVEAAWQGPMRSRTADAWSALRRLPTALLGSHAREAAYQRSLASLRAQYPLAPLQGSVDVLPWDIFRVLVHSMDYRPRPILESHAALNDSLARRNAEFFESKNAPDYVLMDPVAIDGRYPSLTDNLAWIPLLTRYEPTAFSGPFLVLRKSPEPARVQMTPILSRTISWRQELQVPADGANAIWAEVDISPRFWANLMTMLLRPVPIVLRIATHRDTNAYRLPILLGRSGFLLSPQVNDPISFASLYLEGKKALPERRVFRISLETGLGSAFYKPEIQIRLYRLTIQRRRMPPLFSNGLLELADTAKSASRLDHPAPPPHWSDFDGRLALEVSAPSSGAIAVSKAIHAVELGFGLRGCDGAAGVVEFRATYAGHLLLQRTLSASGPQEISAKEVVRLPASGGGKLILETAQAQGECIAGANWFEVKPVG